MKTPAYLLSAEQDLNHDITIHELSSDSISVYQLCTADVYYEDKDLKDYGVSPEQLGVK